MYPQPVSKFSRVFIVSANFIFFTLSFDVILFQKENILYNLDIIGVLISFLHFIEYKYSQL